MRGPRGWLTHPLQLTSLNFTLKNSFSQLLSSVHVRITSRDVLQIYSQGHELGRLQ
jgi:hypothetical protein